MHVLIVEYIHAQSTAFEQSSDSMRHEGRCMLDALVEDAEAIEGVRITKALCSAAALVMDDKLAIQVNDGPEFSFAEDLLSACKGHHFDKVFVVAPESGEILSQIIRRLRHRGMEVCAPSLQSITLCADKLATYQFLQRLRIPCIPTRSLTEFSRLDLSNDDQLVIKPRDGAGCENIVRLKVATLQTQLLQIDETEQSASKFDQQLEWPYLNAPLDYLVQPFIAGNSYSVGVVGRGLGNQPLVLPVARQAIEWDGNIPAYSGGTILTVETENVSSDMQAIASTIAEALKIESGYVGIDFLIRQGTGEAIVSEINPRLCTSYVGYRKATSSNLAEIFLQTRSQTPMIWDQTPAEFDIVATG